MATARKSNREMPDIDRGPAHAPSDPFDDVLVRRARLKRISSLGQRTGYGLYVASLVCGAIGIRWGYTPLLATLIAVALVVGSMLLAPTIVISHGIKAAEREERRAAATRSTQ